MLNPRGQPAMLAKYKQVSSAEISPLNRSYLNVMYTFLKHFVRAAEEAEEKTWELAKAYYCHLK